MRYKIFILFIFLLFSSACEELTENILERDAIENYTSPYQGNYNGTFSGAESGNFTLQVGKSGTVFGLRNGVDNFGGKIYDGGSLLNVSSPTSGFTLQGNINQNSGTWVMGNKSGTWFVTKQ